jgi:hypothetical protein
MKCVSTTIAMVASSYYFMLYLLNAYEAFIIDGVLLLCVRFIMKDRDYLQQKRSDEAQHSHAADCA